MARMFTSPWQVLSVVFASPLLFFRACRFPDLLWLRAITCVCLPRSCGVLLPLPLFAQPDVYLDHLFQLGEGLSRLWFLEG